MVLVILKTLFQEQFSEHIIRNYEAKQGFRSCNFAKIQSFVYCPCQVAPWKNFNFSIGFMDSFPM